MKKVIPKAELQYLSASNERISFCLERYVVFYIFKPDEIFNFEEFKEETCSQNVILEWVQQKSMDEKEDIYLSRQIKLVIPDYNNLEKDTILPYGAIDYSMTEINKSFFIRIFRFGFGIFVLRKELLKYMNLIELEVQQQEILEAWTENFPTDETSKFWQDIFEGRAV